MPSIIDDKRAAAAREREAAQQKQRQQQQQSSNTRTGAASAPGLVVSEDFTPRDGQGPLPENPELGASEQVPPAYSEQHDQLSLHQAGFDAGATLTGEYRGGPMCA